MHPNGYDPQVFEETKLPNGIKVYTHRLKSPVCYLDVILPLGSAHCVPSNNLPGGAMHFLEHAVFLQSSHHQAPHEYDLELALKGCDRGGTTYPFFTRYDIAAPLENLSLAQDALLETTLEPVFTESLLATERDVVRNERDRLKRFYPGRNRVHQYVNTQFRWNNPVSLDQTFGTDAELDSFKPEELQRIHRATHFAQDTMVLAVGNSDFSELIERLNKIETSPAPRAVKYVPSHWVDPTFRYESFDEVNHPTYTCAWLMPCLDYDEYIALQFILKYLTNVTHGVLYDEYRKRRGWTYSIGYFSDANNLETVYGFDITLQDKEQIETVHMDLLQRARAGMIDDGRIAREIERRTAYQAFSYQTAESIVRGARGDLLSGDRIRSIAEWQASLERMRDPDWCLYCFDRLFDQESMGSLALLPPA
jgi:predicted Zn-dependent peptidase